MNFERISNESALYPKKVESFGIGVDCLRKERQYEHLAQLREHINSTCVKAFGNSILRPKNMGQIEFTE